jgi:hypothetical protein
MWRHQYYLVGCIYSQALFCLDLPDTTLVVLITYVILIIRIYEPLLHYVCPKYFKSFHNVLAECYFSGYLVTMGTETYDGLSLWWRIVIIQNSKKTSIFSDFALPEDLSFYYRDLKPSRNHRVSQLLYFACQRCGMLRVLAPLHLRVVYVTPFSSWSWNEYSLLWKLHSIFFKLLRILCDKCTKWECNGISPSVCRSVCLSTPYIRKCCTDFCETWYSKLEVGWMDGRTDWRAGRRVDG